MASRLNRRRGRPCNTARPGGVPRERPVAKPGHAMVIQGKKARLSGLPVFLSGNFILETHWICGTGRFLLLICGGLADVGGQGSMLSEQVFDESSESTEDAVTFATIAKGEFRLVHHVRRAQIKFSSGGIAEVDEILAGKRSAMNRGAVIAVFV